VGHKTLADQILLAWEKEMHVQRYCVCPAVATVEKPGDLAVAAEHEVAEEDHAGVASTVYVLAQSG